MHRGENQQRERKKDEPLTNRAWCIQIAPVRRARRGGERRVEADRDRPRAAARSGRV